MRSRVTRKRRFQFFIPEGIGIIVIFDLFHAVPGIHAAVSLRNWIAVPLQRLINNASVLIIILL